MTAVRMNMAPPPCPEGTSGSIMKADRAIPVDKTRMEIRHPDTHPPATLQDILQSTIWGSVAQSILLRKAPLTRHGDWVAKTRRPVVIRWCGGIFMLIQPMWPGGSENNPDLFVKIWFDVSGRTDVNYFHVSVPDIEVYSAFPDDGTYDQKCTTIMDNRYIRHEYWR